MVANGTWANGRSTTQWHSPDRQLARKIKADGRIRQLGGSIPTLIDMAGGNVPKHIDGRSFKRVLLGKTDSHRNEIFTIVGTEDISGKIFGFWCSN